MDKEVKGTGRHALHLIEGHRPQIVGAIPRLLEELAPRGVLQTFVALHVAARQKPSARERTGGLLDDEDPAGVIDARDDRADPGPGGHARYGVFLGVGKGGSVPVGKPMVGVGPGVRVGTGVRVGVGDAGVGQGSGATRLQV